MSDPRIALVRGSATHQPFPDEMFQCAVTSPPYYSLREYDGEQEQTWGGDTAHAHVFTELATTEGYGGRTRWQHQVNGLGQVQSEDVITRTTRPEVWTQVSQGGYCECGAWRGALGLEPVPDCGAWALAFGVRAPIEPCSSCYICHMVVIFREVRRVLRKDGTFWLNIGDSYASKARGSDKGWEASRLSNPGYMQKALATSMKMQSGQRHRGKSAGFKEKDLMMIPARLALALQTDGWWVRAENIWSKTNPMPDSTGDRTTMSHEHVWMLTKAKRYYYDRKAIQVPLSAESIKRVTQARFDQQQGGPKDYGTAGISRSRSGRHALEELRENVEEGQTGRNAWTMWEGWEDEFLQFLQWKDAQPVESDVWKLPTRRYLGAHFATFPPQLAERCVLAGSRPGDWVLDPFNGTGTTGRVAVQHLRSYAGLDVSAEYLSEQSVKRLRDIQHEMQL